MPAPLKRRSRTADSTERPKAPYECLKPRRPTTAAALDAGNRKRAEEDRKKTGRNRKAAEAGTDRGPVTPRFLNARGTGKPERQDQKKAAGAPGGCRAPACENDKVNDCPLVDASGRQGKKPAPEGTAGAGDEEISDSNPGSTGPTVPVQHDRTGTGALFPSRR